MKNKILLIVIFLLGIISAVFPQQTFRKAIFLHRSVGGNVYGPNGSSTGVAAECQSYNLAHNYTGSNAVSMDEVNFPWNGNSGNAWWEWHNVFDGTDPDDDIYQYINSSDVSIIIIKTCYTVSGMTEGWGVPADTTHYDWKSQEVFRWHVRSVLKIMEQHPEKFFVMWNLVPVLNNGSFSPSVVANDALFSVWMKDTLATGLDATYGVFPPNVYVFDIFNKVDSSNYMPTSLSVSASDNHLNASATELLAPQFVQEVFDAAIHYEQRSVPVELTLFSGNYENGVVNLKWVTATETNNFGFEVERRNDSSPYESIGFVNGNGTSTNRVTYNFIDKNLSADRYYYRIKQIDFDGKFEYSNELEIDFYTLATYSLEQNYPNPFNPTTEINFTLAKSGNISLKLFNNLGAEVATLADGFMNSGKHSLKFNAKNLTTGIYYYRLKADNFTSTRKMLLIK